MDIVISSGHGLYVRGASGILDEVDEARRVVERVAETLREAGIEVVSYHDDISQTQNENLNRIVDFHNSQERKLDISVHFNASVETDDPMGTECLYVTQKELADRISTSIADCGFKNRGPKYRSDLFFLNNTVEPSILIETCFVDSSADAEIYGSQFGEVCQAIADVLIGLGGEAGPEEEPPDAAVSLRGTVSQFGGPADTGVDDDEGLAFIYEVDDAPHLFLPYQPEGTTGLARRLNPFVHYIACRWDYEETPRDMLLEKRALVRSLRSGVAMKAFPADWGPHIDTGRVADISPGLMEDLGMTTDDEVEVIFPAEDEA